MAARKPDKVAVVVIHGMGEQRPMETLRGFDRMQDLAPAARELIAATNPLFAMPAGATLLDAGSSDD